MTSAEEALQAASRGLTYESETDAPFTSFTWKADGGELNAKKVLQLGRHGSRTPVEEVTLQDFFGDLVADQDWHGAAEKADTKKYRALLQAIQQQLAGAKVYKVGRAEKTVYIVGKAKDGSWVGLRTKAVET